MQNQQTLTTFTVVYIYLMMLVNFVITMFLCATDRFFVFNDTLRLPLLAHLNIIYSVYSVLTFIAIPIVTLMICYGLRTNELMRGDTGLSGFAYYTWVRHGVLVPLIHTVIAIFVVVVAGFVVADCTSSDCGFTSSTSLFDMANIIMIGSAYAIQLMECVFYFVYIMRNADRR